MSDGAVRLVGFGRSPVNSPVTHEHRGAADPEVTSLAVGEPKFPWLCRLLAVA
jgi:hypothetical protein